MALRQKRAIRGSSLPEIMRHFFLTGAFPGLDVFPHGTPGRFETFRLTKPELIDEALRKYQAHRQEVLEYWRAQEKKGLPWAEKQLLKQQKKGGRGNA